MGVEGFPISRLTAKGRHNEIQTRFRQWYFVRSSSKQSKAAAKFWESKLFQPIQAMPLSTILVRHYPLPRTQANNRKHYVAYIFKINERMANKNHQPPAFWKNHCSTNRQTNRTNNRPRGNRKTEASERPNSNEGANAFLPRHATTSHFLP